MSENFDSGASSNVPGFADALQRAKQIASKIKTTDGPASSPLGLKRPSDDFFAGPNSKKPYDMIQGGNEHVNVATETIMVPDKMVGLIIGRGGEQITRLQAETGCKVQMAPDSQGSSERPCTLTGPPSAIGNAKLAIERIIANEGNGPQRGMGMNTFSDLGAPAGSNIFEMIVPGDKVGLIIGKGGETIKQLQEATGAKMVIVQDSAAFANEKPLKISGTPESIEHAKEMVIEILNQNEEGGGDPMGFGGRGRGRGRGMGGGMIRGGFVPRGRGRGGFDRPGGGPGYPSQEYGGQHQEYVSVPAQKCGLIIGKGGETIKSINESTGAYCEIDKKANPDAAEKNFVIRGPLDAVQRAKAMILEKIGMPPGPSEGGGYGGPGAGGYDAGWNRQYQDISVAGMNPQTGLADYSLHWIEYYRSIGRNQEADAIERQRNAAAAPAPMPHQPAVSATNGAAVNGATDYSLQWAEYYRKMGKIKEAEAVEAGIKQKAAVSGNPHFAPAPAGEYQGYYGSAQPQGPSAYPAYPGYPSYQPSGEN